MSWNPQRPPVPPGSPWWRLFNRLFVAPGALRQDGSGVGVNLTEAMVDLAAACRELAAALREFNRGDDRF